MKKDCFGYTIKSFNTDVEADFKLNKEKLFSEL